MWLFVAFLAIPLIEIALFIQVGGLIGLWPTLGIVIITAILGTSLMRSQGALAMRQIRASFDEMRDPSEPLAHGAMILFAGALLITPGILTDSVGFLLLIPALRSMAFRWLRSRVNVQSFSTGPAPGPKTAQDDVIDGEFTEVPTDKRPTHQPSGWTRH